MQALGYGWVCRLGPPRALRTAVRVLVLFLREMGNTAGFTLLWVGGGNMACLLFMKLSQLCSGEWVNTGDRSEGRRVSKILK